MRMYNGEYFNLFNSSSYDSVNAGFKFKIWKHLIVSKF